MPQFIIDIDQGSDDWKRLRMGKATASNFDRIVTEANGKYAAGADTYAREVAVQRVLKEDTEKPISGLYWVERGKELEPQAVKHYESLPGHRTTASIGLIISDDNTRACSPDRISADRLWGAEFKAPSGPEHLEYMKNGPGRKYRWQVVGSILVAGFDGWDFVSFHPRMKEVVLSYAREQYVDEIELLDAALNRFEASVQEYCDLIRREGFVEMIGQAEQVPPSEWQKMLEADPNLWAIA